MKVPVSWLKEYVSIDLPLKKLAERLTMAGSEVKGIQEAGGSWKNIFVGQIVDIKPHPNADRLSLVTVDLATEQLTVVCGAPNLKLGDKVAFARVGAELIDGHSGQRVILKPARIRGVDSGGMVCSEKELAISDRHEDIMVLPPEAPVGARLTRSAILDLDITPNRPDLLSVIGIAREVAALTGQKPTIAEATYEEKGAAIEKKISVEIVDTDLCPRYCCSLINGIKIGDSPEWLKSRLSACGLRPINNIVDITNYVMLEYGQPLHAFDYDRIRGKRIIVRRASAAETIVSLEGVQRVLDGDMLVIADMERAIAIAGVMGGANSEVDQETSSILLESANFNPASIHYTSHRLRLASEAAMRFERGIGPELPLPAIKRATQLILELAGGKVAQGIVDAYPGKKQPKAILLSQNRVRAVLGVDISINQVARVLTSLGCSWTPEMIDEFEDFGLGEVSEEIRVYPPYWRSDLNLDVDLIEEVARIIGYDRIPVAMLAHPLPQQDPEPNITLKQRVSQSLTGYGFQEVITYSLTSLEVLKRLWPESNSPEPMPLRVANPMTIDQEYLRTTLRANLLEAVAGNRRHEEGGIRLFELGRVFLPRPGDLPDEPEVLCAVLSGSSLEKSWPAEGKPFDFFDAKGVVESLLGQLGVTADFEVGNDKGLRPGSQAIIVVAGDRLGVVGQFHPRVSQAFDISGPVYLFELNLTALLPHTLSHKGYQPIARYPAIVRDIAIIVDVGVTHRQVNKVIKGFSLVKQVTLFDVYSGKPVPTGRKSLAYRLTFQSPSHTLTDEEADRVQQQILDRLSTELGATLRA